MNIKWPANFLLFMKKKLMDDCLLSTHNVAFARLLAETIIRQTQFLDYPIKTIHLNNVRKFPSQIFIDYCMLVRIDIEHLTTHTHNDMIESLIKCL